MALEFDADAAAAELRAAVLQTVIDVQAVLPVGEKQKLYRTDHDGNLVTADGVLVRKKLEPLKLGGK